MKPTRWRIRVEDIPDAGFSLEVDSRDSSLVELLGELAEGSAGPLAGYVSLQVEPWPKRVDVTGTLEAKVPLQCARCLEGYVHSLQRPFSQILSRARSDASEEEIELRSSDLDRSELVGDTLDLKAIVREEFMLSLPTKPLCTETCMGICGGCGAELNRAECTCPPKIDDRWAALVELKASFGKKEG